MAHVFISYKHKDGDFADILKQELEKAHFEVWIDANIKSGEYWREDIEQAIRSSFALIVIVTPESSLSPYVTYEWAYALGIGVTVIPLLLQPLEKSHPLDRLQHEDFTNRRTRPWDQLIGRIQETKINFSLMSQSQSVPSMSSKIPNHFDLLERLFSEDELTRYAVIDDLVVVGKSIVPMLIRFLKSSDAWKREGAVMALGEIGDPQAVFSLIYMLNNDEIRAVRRAAEEALVQINTPDALEAVREWRNKNYSENLPF